MSGEPADFHEHPNRKIRVYKTFGGYTIRDEEAKASGPGRIFVSPLKKVLPGIPGKFIPDFDLPVW